MGILFVVFKQARHDLLNSNWLAKPLATADWLRIFIQKNRTISKYHVQWLGTCKPELRVDGEQPNHLAMFSLIVCPMGTNLDFHGG